MRWIAIFNDTPDMIAIRKARAPLHLDYLEKHATEILIAGGSRNEPSGDFIGGLWVLEVTTRERAVQLIENDPYYTPACRTYQLRTWGKAFEDKQVLL